MKKSSIFFFLVFLSLCFSLCSQAQARAEQAVSEKIREPVPKEVLFVTFESEAGPVLINKKEIKTIEVVSCFKSFKIGGIGGWGIFYDFRLEVSVGNKTYRSLASFEAKGEAQKAKEKMVEEWGLLE